MDLYRLALFVHISGAVGIFGSLGAIVFGSVALRRAGRTEDVRVLTRLITVAGNVAAVCIVILGIAGFYMALTAWGASATWIIVATISFMLLAPFGLLVIDPRVRSIAKQALAAPDGPLPETLARRVTAQARMLEVFLSIYVTWLLGIVYLMTNKPTTSEAIVVMLIAGTFGLVMSQPWRLRTKDRIPASRG
ncbi:MAG TPA: DUF2269 family protein [Ktedonobacterales bacterium]|nr:DUF2269 family protein [Ktedonobacterales bacterium]